jgi:hypothetical protein
VGWEGGDSNLLRGEFEYRWDGFVTFRMVLELGGLMGLLD